MRRITGIIDIIGSYIDNNHNDPNIDDNNNDSIIVTINGSNHIVTKISSNHNDTNIIGIDISDNDTATQ